MERKRLQPRAPLRTLFIVLRYTALDMREVVAAILLVCGIAWLGSAVVLIGAVLSLGRSDHRNPVAYRWIAWHARHSFRSIHL